MNKPSIVFYIGYVNLSAQNYGSELALVKLTSHLKKWYKIYVITNVPYEIPGIHCISEKEYIRMSFDCIIISRYINFYIHLPIRAPCVYIWIHDIGLQPFFSGIELPECGRWLLDNVICHGIITQTQWHKSIFQSWYPSTADNGTLPVYVIGNGIDTDKFKRNSTKIPYRFIWTSCPTRGLSYLLEIFPKIKEKYPESQLDIYRGLEKFTAQQLETIQSLSEYVHYKGSISNDEIVTEFLKSEVWLYTTDFHETFCISALEAQTAGCLCICTNKGSLGEVVNNRGILLNSPYASEEYLKEIFTGLEIVFENRDSYSRRASEWGIQQDWSNRAIMWKNLIDTEVNSIKN